MQETLTTLGIDWRELLAQTINFGIILFVLWKWAYKPVLDMLRQRRERIEQSMLNADKIKQELARTEAMQKEILEKASLQAGKMIEEARAAAARVQETETQKAIAQAEQIIAKANEATALERTRMLTDLRKEVGTLVVRTTGQVIGKVLSPEEQNRLSEEARRQLAA